jgi:predicted nucleotidyltransferase
MAGVATSEVIDALRGHRDELRRRGVRRLALFGSAAEGTAGPESDLDFIVRLEPKSFDAYMDLKLRLEELFGRRVDLVLESQIKALLRNRILSQAVDVPGL